MVATTELMLALIKGVVNAGVVLSLKPILKSWQLCLSFKLDVHRHPHPTHSSLYLPNNLYLIILYHFNIINKVDYNNSYMYVCMYIVFIYYIYCV